MKKVIKKKCQWCSHLFSLRYLNVWDGKYQCKAINACVKRSTNMNLQHRIGKLKKVKNHKPIKFKGKLFCASGQTGPDPKAFIFESIFDYVGTSVILTEQSLEPLIPYRLVVEEDSKYFEIIDIKIGLNSQFMNTDPIRCTDLESYYNSRIWFRETVNVGQLITLKVKRIK